MVVLQDIIFQFPKGHTQVHSQKSFLSMLFHCRSDICNFFNYPSLKFLVATNYESQKKKKTVAKTEMLAWCYHILHSTLHPSGLWVSTLRPGDWRKNLPGLWNFYSLVGGVQPAHNEMFWSLWLFPLQEHLWI